jgi:hypothetical protein
MRISLSGGGYGWPQPLLAGGIPTPGSGVGVAVGFGVGASVTTGVVGVDDELPPHAASAMSAQAAQKARMEGLDFKNMLLWGSPMIGALEV